MILSFILNRTYHLSACELSNLFVYLFDAVPFSYPLLITVKATVVLNSVSAYIYRSGL